MSIVSSLLTVKEYYDKKAIAYSGVSGFAREPFAQMLNDGKCRFFSIVVLNRTLGRIILFTDLDDKDLADGKSICYFSNLWVHPKLRGHKIGSKLVRFVEKEAKESGFEFLALGVHKDNEKNMSIYSHMGFDTFVKNKAHDVVVKDETGKYIDVKEYSVLKKKL